jgi:hypothetical protein
MKIFNENFLKSIGRFVIIIEDLKRMSLLGEATIQRNAAAQKGPKTPMG